MRHCTHLRFHRKARNCYSSRNPQSVSSPRAWNASFRLLENFPDLANSYNDVTDLPGFHGFVGEEAEPEVWDYYVKKRVPKHFQRSQNAVRYLEPEA